MKMETARRVMRSAVRPLLAISTALLIGAALILSAGENPLRAFGILFTGAFGSTNAFLNTLGNATPLLFTGLAAVLAARVGVFNIGIEGQLYLGALAAAVIGTYVGVLPAPIAILLCMLGAMVAASLWALIPGLINSKLNVNIFVMFFMLNNMAILFTEFLANGPFQGNLPEAATDRVSAAARLYRFTPFATLSTGIFLALALVALVWFVMQKTRFGYECDAVGKNPSFSEYIGVRVKGRQLFVLILSACIAGLAGAEPVLGHLGRFFADFSNELGFVGIAIALLAQNSPAGVVVFAIFFGALQSGGLLMEAGTNVPGDLVNVVQSLLIVLISADFVIRSVKGKKQRVKVKAGDTL